MQGLLQEEIILQLESRELLNLQADLQGRVQGEKEEIERLRQELAAAHSKYNYRFVLIFIFINKCILRQI